MNRREGRKGERNVIRLKRVLVQNYTTSPKRKAAPKDNKTMWNARSTYPSLPSQEASWPGAPSKCQALIHHTSGTHTRRIWAMQRGRTCHRHTLQRYCSGPNLAYKRPLAGHTIPPCRALSGNTQVLNATRRDATRRNTIRHVTYGMPTTTGETT